MNKIQLVYIAGYSRSGSTILDIMLGTQEGITSTGEVGYILDHWYDQNRKCACGEKYEYCKFWGDFLERKSYNRKTKNIIREIDSRKNLGKLKKDQFSKDKIRIYKDFNEYLYKYITNKSNNQIIVESSKSARDMAGRFYALDKYVNNIDVYVIHLIRDGLLTLNSYLKKGRNWAIEGHVENDRFQGMRAIMGWCLANRIASQLGKKIPNYIKLKYSELLKHSEKSLNKVSNYINKDLSNIIKKVKKHEPLKKGHNVGGNRIRKKNKIIFKTNKKLKKDHEITWYYKIMFYLCQILILNKIKV